MAARRTAGIPAPVFGPDLRDAVLARVPGRYGREEALEAFHELMELQEAGQLFSEDIFEEYFAANGAVNAGPPVVKALCLHIAHDCNLRCRYCFASTGDFGTGRALMPADTGRNAIDFLIERSGTRKNLEVDFSAASPS